MAEEVKEVVLMHETHNYIALLREYSTIECQLCNANATTKSIKKGKKKKKKEKSVFSRRRADFNTSYAILSRSLFRLTKDLRCQRGGGR